MYVCRFVCVHMRHVCTCNSVMCKSGKVWFYCFPLACYGLPNGGCGSMMRWRCGRCVAGPSHLQDCCLCQLRGGALKPTDGGRWAHLICAEHIPEVSLGNEELRDPIITDSITRATRKLVSDKAGCTQVIGYLAMC